MTALDWDEIPHPVRAMAALRMVRWRVAEAAPAGAFGITADEITETLSAILMVESWFEHRAVNVNPRGDRDLGLAQASEFCRNRLEALHESGCVEQAFTEQDYFDPWRATEVATVWFLLMLEEAEGDLGLAVRAYHRGIAAARAGAGQAYFEQVEKRKRGFRDTTSRSWRIAMERSREIGPGPGDLPASRLPAANHVPTRYPASSEEAMLSGSRAATGMAHHQPHQLLERAVVVRARSTVKHGEARIAAHPVSSSSVQVAHVRAGQPPVGPAPRAA